jgi:hypothetical protein
MTDLHSIGFDMIDFSKKKSVNEHAARRMMMLFQTDDHQEGSPLSMD